MTEPENLEALLAQIRSCRLCEAHLPLGPRPVLRARSTARILIVGQAPGTRVHETGIPWNDRSGERLRQWLDLPAEAFYDERNIAIMPSGFCYPGVDPKGGDKPPRPECAPLWHPQVLPHLPARQLTLLVGLYAQRHYLGTRRRGTLTETVAHFADYLPEFFPLPHPSWRATGWLRRNPWFEAEVLPVLRQWAQAALDPLAGEPGAPSLAP